MRPWEAATKEEVVAELTDETRTWLTGRHKAVLITLRADGSPQSSNVLTAFDGEVFRVSVTTGRAKTHNLRRDPRAVVHLLGDTFWSYASVASTAEVGAVTREPGDGPGRELLALYDSISPTPHPDPAEFFAAMVAEHRLVLTLHPHSISGMQRG